MISGLLQQDGIFLHFNSLMHEEGCVTTVIYNQIRSGTIRPGECLFSTPPVLFKSFSLPGKNSSRTGRSNCSRSMILSRKNITGGPAQIRTQCFQCFDEHGCLDGQMKAAHDLETLQGFLFAVFLSDGHQTGHFIFRQGHFLAAPIRQRPIRNLILQVSINL